MVIVIVAVLAGAACQAREVQTPTVGSNATSKPRQSTCYPKLPDFARGAVAGSITSADTNPGLTMTLETAVRDSTMTLIEFCGGPALPAQAPSIQIGSKELAAAGTGALGVGQQSALYFVYPPTHPELVHIRLNGQLAGDIHFPRLADLRCPLMSETADVSLLACGSLLRFAWRTPLKARSAIGIVDAECSDPTNGRALGFYLEGIGGSGSGLKLFFACQRPAGITVTLTLYRILTQAGRSVAFHGPVRQDVALSSEG